MRIEPYSERALKALMRRLPCHPDLGGLRDGAAPAWEVRLPKCFREAIAERLGNFRTVEDFRAPSDGMCGFALEYGLNSGVNSRAAAEALVAEVLMNAPCGVDLGPVLRALLKAQRVHRMESFGEGAICFPGFSLGGPPCPVKKEAL